MQMIIDNYLKNEEFKLKEDGKILIKWKYLFFDRFSPPPLSPSRAPRLPGWGWVKSEKTYVPIA